MMEKWRKRGGKKNELTFYESKRTHTNTLIEREEHIKVLADVSKRVIDAK